MTEPPEHGFVSHCYPYIVIIVKRRPAIWYRDVRSRTRKNRPVLDGHRRSWSLFIRAYRSFVPRWFLRKRVIIAVVHNLVDRATVTSRRRTRKYREINRRPGQFGSVPCPLRVFRPTAVVRLALANGGRTGVAQLPSISSGSSFRLRNEPSKTKDKKKETF